MPFQMDVDTYLPKYYLSSPMVPALLPLVTVVACLYRYFERKSILPHCHFLHF